MKSASLIQLLEAVTGQELAKQFAELDKNVADTLKRIGMLKAAGEVVKVNLDSILRNAPAPEGRLDPKTEQLRKLYTQVEYALTVACNAESDMNSVNACIKSKVDDTEGVFLNLFNAVRKAIQVPEQRSYRHSSTPPPLPKPKDTQTYELVPINYKAETYHIPREEAEVYALLKKPGCVEIKDNHIVSANFKNDCFYDIEKLAMLPFMTDLNLSFCSMRDISCISKLVQVRKLDLTCNEFRTLSGLEKLPNLYQLNVSFCSNLRDISALEKMNNLRQVHITGSKIDYDNPATIKTIQSLIKRGVQVDR